MSKNVKILLSRDISYDNEYDYTSQRIIQESISDWEEISDEDYEFLRLNFCWLFKDYTKEYNLVPSLIVKDNKPVIERIESIKTYMEQEKYRQAKEKAAEDAKKAERAKQRMLKKAKSEKELYEMLKDKFETK